MGYTNTTVGILTNHNYSPSVLAYQYIQEVLENAGIKTIALSLDHIIKNEINCDTIFNVYYGEIGDGGIVSGLLEKLGVPFIGNTQYTCSLMMNKVVSKLFFLRHKCNTPPFWYEPDAQKSVEDIIKEVEDKIKYPLLAKPVNGAASENIHLINRTDELRSFISNNRAFVDGSYFFFEEFQCGRELSVGYVDGLETKLPVVEIKLLGDMYQSNKVKFSPGLKENIIPANLPVDVYNQAQKIAHDLHIAFNCSSFSRTDMIYDEHNQKLYVLEINTNPGLLEKSLLPLMVKTAGVSNIEFFLHLIRRSLNY